MVVFQRQAVDPHAPSRHVFRRSVGRSGVCGRPNARRGNGSRPFRPSDECLTEEATSGNVWKVAIVLEPFHRLLAGPPATCAPVPEGMWRRLAACQLVDPAVFFSDSRGRAPAGYWDAAAGVCEACEVRSECLEDALSLPAACDLGFRAGLTRSERRALR